MTPGCVEARCDSATQATEISLGSGVTKSPRIQGRELVSLTQQFNVFSSPSPNCEIKGRSLRLVTRISASGLRANRDLGRIFKTEFLLVTCPSRSCGPIRRGLLKVEQLHALARDVYYGRRGRINARELHGQMNSCSCLTLILACVIYWKAKEISRVVRWCKPEDDKIDIALLEHISPIESDNVILYGQYVLDRAQVR